MSGLNVEEQMKKSDHLVERNLGERIEDKKSKERRRAMGELEELLAKRKELLAERNVLLGKLDQSFDKLKEMIIQ